MSLLYGGWCVLCTFASQSVSQAELQCFWQVFNIRATRITKHLHDTSAFHFALTSCKEEEEEPRESF